MRQPTAMEMYRFDLNGYLILRNALEPELVDALNAEFDAFPRDLPMGAWYKGAQRRDYNPKTGMELHNCIEMGGPFAKLIDHPSWLGLVRTFCGEYQSYVEGVFIDECVASVRETGGSHWMHSGGYRGALRGRYEYRDGVFRCGQVNILMALTDVHEGDGATLVVPGSHKSHFPYPEDNEGEHPEFPEGAVPAYLNKGDALLFVDGIRHGGSDRTNRGERRVIIFRYGPSWAQTRFGYQYSEELLASLTPEQRLVAQPVPPCPPGSDFVPVEAPVVARKVLGGK